jgi:DNA-directed RNA polymerase subunit N (RpoN/RPB10)
MLIPVRCHTCNKVIATKWEEYNNLIREAKQSFELLDKQDTTEASNRLVFIKGQALDTCRLTRYCCRTIFLGQTDILDEVIKYS